MSERDRSDQRIAVLEKQIESAREEKEVRKRLVVSGVFWGVGAGLSFVDPVFIPPAVGGCIEFRRQAGIYRKIEERKAYLKEMNERLRAESDR